MRFSNRKNAIPLVLTLMSNSSQISLKSWTLVGTSRIPVNTLHSDRVHVCSTRTYPGIGTIHFFPNKKKNLVDRLNRLVGKHRQWLPPNEESVTKNFWQAYDKAEKFDGELRQAVANASPRSWGRSPFHDLFSSGEEDRAGAASHVVSAIEQVLEANGISPHFQALEQKQPEQLLLAA